MICFRIQKICDTCKDYGIPLPEYIVHPEDTMLKLNVLEKKVLKLIGTDRKIKQTEIAKRLNVSIASVQRVMKRMVEHGEIERKGGKRYGYWEIKK